MNWKIRLVKDVYARCSSRNEFQKLFRLIDWFLQLPKPQELTFWQEIQNSDEEKRMPFITTPERMFREEGLREGLLKAIQLGLRLQYKSRGSALFPAAQALTDTAQLEALLGLIEKRVPLNEIRKALAAK